jgi:hypothetical protein
MADALLTMEVLCRHARPRAIIRDAVSPANRPDSSAIGMSRDVARVVSDVSVLCPRDGVCLATHLCDVTRPATSAVTGYEGPGWTGQLEQQVMPLLQDYGSVVVEDRDSLWQQWPTEVR